MTSLDQEHIDVEPFDRDYEMEDLLPAKTLERLFRGTAALWPDMLCLARHDGAIYFQCGPWTSAHLTDLVHTIAHTLPHSDCVISCAHGPDVFIFPLVYELETKGYLAIPGPQKNQEDLADTGVAIIQVLGLLMNLKHQTMLTSGLHGVVVEESYAQLKEKADLLAASEEKYRQLAANLEIEVQKKTEQIRIAHAHLMQQEKLVAIGQLSAGVAHEINNPLGFIISNLNTLRDYAEDLRALIEGYRHLIVLSAQQPLIPDGSPLQQQLKAIQDMEKALDADFLLTDLSTLTDESISGAERIQKIVADLKAVARPGEKSPELINIHKSIDAVLTILHNRMGDGVTVHKAYGPLPLVPGFAAELNQVWLNLLINAIDAMQGRGTLSISTHADRDLISVSVSDTGRGIPQEHLSQIFDPFFTTQEVGRGMGLGLHLVYHLVHKHNGRIDVTSVEGQGSTFCVSLSAAGSK